MKGRKIKEVKVKGEKEGLKESQPLKDHINHFKAKKRKSFFQMTNLMSVSEFGASQVTREMIGQIIRGKCREKCSDVPKDPIL